MYTHVVIYIMFECRSFTLLLLKVLSVQSIPSGSNINVYEYVTSMPCCSRRMVLLKILPMDSQYILSVLSNKATSLSRL